MPIENRNLTKGTKLIGRYHKQTYTCEVVEDAEGKLHYKLEDGREFKSPSAAGMAITGHSCDGWVFWSVQTEETGGPNHESTAEQAAAEPNQTAETVLCALPRPTPRKPAYFWCRIRRACRKVRFAGSAASVARASSHQQWRYRGFAPTIRSAKTD